MGKGSAPAVVSNPKFHAKVLELAELLDFPMARSLCYTAPIDVPSDSAEKQKVSTKESANGRKHDPTRSPAPTNYAELPLTSFLASLANTAIKTKKYRAMAIFAMCLHTGSFVERNDREAFSMLLRAAEMAEDLSDIETCVNSKSDRQNSSGDVGVNRTDEKSPEGIQASRSTQKARSGISERAEEKDSIVFEERFVARHFGQVLFVLGDWYRRGVGTNACYKNAFQHLRRSIEIYRGNRHCLLLLAYMYETGAGVLRDEEAAFELYYEAAEMGSLAAQFKVGQMYEMGKGIHVDYHRAKSWYKIAACQGHFPSVVRLSILSLDSAFETFPVLEAAANQVRTPQSFHDMALAYSTTRHGLEVDPKSMKFWLTSAAKAGNVRAQFILGRMYADGYLILGLTEGNDITLSSKNTDISGDSEADAFNSSEISTCSSASPTKENFNKSRFEAQLPNLSPPDMQRAFYWLHQAALQGLQIAQLAVSNMYQKGIGTQKDHGLAEHWRRAANRCSCQRMKQNIIDVGCPTIFSINQQSQPVWNSVESELRPFNISTPLHDSLVEPAVLGRAVAPVSELEALTVLFGEGLVFCRTIVSPLYWKAILSTAELINSKEFPSSLDDLCGKASMLTATSIGAGDIPRFGKQDIDILRYRSRSRASKHFDAPETELRGESVEHKSNNSGEHDLSNLLKSGKIFQQSASGLRIVTESNGCGSPPPSMVLITRKWEEAIYDSFCAGLAGDELDLGFKPFKDLRSLLSSMHHKMNKSLQYSTPSSALPQTLTTDQRESISAQKLKTAVQSANTGESRSTVSKNKGSTQTNPSAPSVSSSQTQQLHSISSQPAKFHGTYPIFPSLSELERFRKSHPTTFVRLYCSKAWFLNAESFAVTGRFYEAVNAFLFGFMSFEGMLDIGVPISNKQQEGSSKFSPERSATAQGAQMDRSEQQQQNSCSTPSNQQLSTVTRSYRIRLLAEIAAQAVLTNNRKAPNALLLDCFINMISRPPEISIVYLTNVIVAVAEWEAHYPPSHNAASDLTKTTSENQRSGKEPKRSVTNEHHESIPALLSLTEMPDLAGVSIAAYVVRASQWAKLGRFNEAILDLDLAIELDTTSNAVSNSKKNNGKNSTNNPSSFGSPNDGAAVASAGPATSQTHQLRFPPATPRSALMAECWYQKGVVLSNMEGDDNQTKAISCFQKYISIAGADGRRAADAHVSIAGCYLALDSVRKLVEHFSKALEVEALRCPVYPPIVNSRLKSLISAEVKYLLVTGDRDVRKQPWSMVPSSILRQIDGLDPVRQGPLRDMNLSHGLLAPNPTARSQSNGQPKSGTQYDLSSSGGSAGPSVLALARECTACGSTGKTFACAGCKSTRYCGKNCQVRYF
ncbi:hypothetical protein BJ742DRAFT_775606 [Cladochytrium replicatum]|nr:hypothetical protein BJ742DRAFT_775606 [Cladochytrium replicatum]